MTIEELNFDTIEYIDSFDLRPNWKTLCSSLKKNVCYKKLSLRPGNHKITILVLDKAGNSALRDVELLVK